MRLLTLCGSLRARSSNRAILRAYERIASSHAACDHYESLAMLPHFNPDLDAAEESLPDEEAILARDDLRQQLLASVEALLSDSADR